MDTWAELCRRGDHRVRALRWEQSWAVRLEMVKGRILLGTFGCVETLGFHIILLTVLRIQ